MNAAPRELALVVAADEEHGIGLNGTLPWRLPGDLRRFRTITQTSPAGVENTVIMGRRTWDSLPARFRPLPGRRNVVLSRAPTLDVPAGVVHAQTLREALELDAPANASTFVIGGGEIYAAALSLPETTTIYMTRVEGRHGCDVFFPALGPDWVAREQAPWQSEAGARYRFEVYGRGR